MVLKLGNPSSSSMCHTVTLRCVSIYMQWKRGFNKPIYVNCLHWFKALSVCLSLSLSLKYVSVHRNLTALYSSSMLPLGPAYLHCDCILACTWFFQKNFCNKIKRPNNNRCRLFAIPLPADFMNVFTARQHSKLCWRAALAIVNPSVRPSVCLSVRLSVCQTLALCQNDSSYDHAVFTGG